MTARGSLADQTALLFMLARWERMEFLARLFTEVPALQAAADAQYIHLLRAAMNCGFEPWGRHWDETCADWSRKRAELIRQMLPNNCAEADKRAA